MTTVTSNKPHSLAFFKKRECLPCAAADATLRGVLNSTPEYRDYINVFQKEDHPALVAAFDLNLYPTVLILNDKGEEISRKVGARYLSEEWFFQALGAIHTIRISEGTK